MRIFLTLLIAFLTFGFGNGQNESSFKDKKRISTEKSLTQSPVAIRTVPEKLTSGKELQKPNSSAVRVRDAKSPVTGKGLFFESPAISSLRSDFSPSAATGDNLFYGYRLANQTFYSFSSENPTKATLVKTFIDGINTISAGELVNGDFYLTSCNINPANLIRLSTDTWEVVSSIPVQQHAIDMAYDYSTQTMYAIADSGDGSLLFTINLNTGAGGSIAQLPIRFVGIAVHLNGTIYGVSVTGDLYTIDKTTGALSLVGATGISPLVGTNDYYTQSIGFDHNTGKLYWAFIISSLEESGLYEINTATGAATRKGYIGTGMQIVALSSPYYSYFNIPTAPTDFTITRGADGALSATLNWTNPALARSGNTLTELSSIRIERNGALVHTIDNPIIGAPESWRDNTISQQGDYIYSIYGVTGEYMGTKTTKSVFVGSDPCEVTTFPLTEGFEGEGDPDCWTSIYHEDLNKPIPSTVEKHSGNQSWRFTSFDIRNLTGSWLISPRLAVTSTPKTLQFFYNTVSYDMEIFRVGYSKLDSDSASFVWVDKIEYVATNGWVEYNYTFPAETKFIAIEYLTMSKWYVYIDDITIDKLPNNDVSVTAITSPKSGGNLSAAETITVSVTNNGAESVIDIPVKFELDGVKKGEGIITDSIKAETTASYTFNAKADLHELKSYTLKAYTDWNSDIHPENDTLSVRVINFGDCIASLPFTESFEDVPELACWTIGYDPGKKNKPGFAQIARTGKQSWSFSSLNEETDQFLMTPELPVGSGKQKSIQFYLNNPTHAAKTEELFQIGYSTTDRNITSFRWSDTWGVGFTNGWVEFIAPPIPADAKYICIHYYSSYQDHLYIDDLTVREISEVDVALVALIAPESGNDLSATEKVTVLVRNAGTQPVSNIPVAFELNGTPKGEGTISGSIAPLNEEIHTFTFNTTVDLSAVDTYTIKAYTGLSGDSAQDNDTLSVQISNTGICKVTDFPYTEGFEDPIGSCWSFYNLDGSFYKWEQTNSFARTGQFSVYHGAGPLDEDGWLVSPKIALPANRTMGFYFWSYNAFDGLTEYGKNSVWVSTGSSNPNSGDFVQAWTPLTPTSYLWEETSLNLGAYAGQDIYIAFRYQGSLKHKWYLDDVTIADISDQVDAGVTAITAPVLNAGDMGNETVTIKVKNFGGQPLTNLPVRFEVNGTMTGNENIPETINPLQEISYSFTTPANLSQAGTYSIKAYTVLEGDAITGNDAASMTITNYGVCEVSSFPYREDFEREADYFICWTVYNPDGDACKWGLESTFSHGLTALHENYSSNQDGWLVSPKINIPSEGIYQLLFLTFTANPEAYTEENKAKSSVWISTGSNDPASGDFKEVWSAKTAINDWREVKINLRKYAGQALHVAFRYEGDVAHLWGVDDVRVSELTGSDAGIIEIIVPEKVNTNTQVKVKIANFGAIPLTSVPVNVYTDGTPVTETFTGNILSGDTTEYTFTQPLGLSKFGFYRLRAYTSLSGDTDASNNEVYTIVAYPEDIHLYGYLFSSNPANINDFYTVKFSLYNPSELIRVEIPYTNDENIKVIAGEFWDNKIYAYTWNYKADIPSSSSANFVRFTSNWTEEAKTLVSQIPIDMAYDYSNRKMYAITSTTDKMITTLKEVNLSTGELTTVVELDCYVYTLAANLNGDLYAVDSDSYLVTIDKESGITSVVAYTRLYPDGNQSMAFDHNSNPERLFWAMYDSGDQTSKLIEFDPLSGKTINNGPIGENAQIVALYTPCPATVKIDFPESTGDAIRIYPNPAHEVVYLTSVPERSQIRIMDLSGRIVFSDNSQSGNVTLNLNLEVGVYMIVIENGGEKTVRKLIIK